MLRRVAAAPCARTTLAARAAVPQRAMSMACVLPEEPEEQRESILRLSTIAKKAQSQKLPARHAESAEICSQQQAPSLPFRRADKQAASGHWRSPRVDVATRWRWRSGGPLLTSTRRPSSGKAPTRCVVPATPPPSLSLPPER